MSITDILLIGGLILIALMNIVGLVKCYKKYGRTGIKYGLKKIVEDTKPSIAPLFALCVFIIMIIVSIDIMARLVEYKANATANEWVYDLLSICLVILICYVPYKIFRNIAGYKVKYNEQEKEWREEEELKRKQGKVYLFMKRHLPFIVKETKTGELANGKEGS